MKEDSPETGMDNTPPPGILGKAELSTSLSPEACGPPGMWTTGANEGKNLVYQASPDSAIGIRNPTGEPVALGPPPSQWSNPETEKRPQGLLPLQGANEVVDKSGTDVGFIAGPPTTLLKELANIVNEDHRPIPIEL